MRRKELLQKYSQLFFNFALQEKIGISIESRKPLIFPTTKLIMVILGWFQK